MPGWATRRRKSAEVKDGGEWAASAEETPAINERRSLPKFKTFQLKIKIVFLVVEIVISPPSK
jgi:hypothetical protein